MNSLLRPIPMNQHRLALLGLLLAAGWLLGAAPAVEAAQAAETAEAAPVARASGYRLGPRDLISIRVYEEPQLNTEVRISEDGSIRLPRVGEVPAEGLSTDELAQRIETVLVASYLQQASVSVEIVDFRSRPISVIGAVTKPGNLDVTGRMTLLEAITAAGGLAPTHGDRLYVLRRDDNGLTDQVTIVLDELLVRGDPDVNIPIYSNDLINVPEMVEVIVYCLGQVARPGATTFKSTENVTLLAAIAQAGGLTDRASKKILIKRRGGRDELTVNYNRIVSGREPDPQLGHGDVVVVKESFF